MTSFDFGNDYDQLCKDGIIFDHARIDDVDGCVKYLSDTRETCHKISNLIFDSTANSAECLRRVRRVGEVPGFPSVAVQSASEYKDRNDLRNAVTLVIRNLELDDSWFGREGRILFQLLPFAPMLKFIVSGTGLRSAVPFVKGQLNFVDSDQVEIDLTNNRIAAIGPYDFSWYRALVRPSDMQVDTNSHRWQSAVHHAYRQYDQQEDHDGHIFSWRFLALAEYDRRRAAAVSVHLNYGYTPSW